MWEAGWTRRSAAGFLQERLESKKRLDWYNTLRGFGWDDPDASNSDAKFEASIRPAEEIERIEKELRELEQAE